MKKIILQFSQTLIGLFSIVHIAIAQPEIEWFKTYGGSDFDAGKVIIQTSDGSYIVAGNTRSNDGDVDGNSNLGIDDSWVVKVDADGNIEWQRCFGSSLLDSAKDIKETPDNGFIVAGYVDDDGIIIEHNGDYDSWLVKLDAQGEVEWQNFYGSSQSEQAHSILLTSDGGYIVAGGPEDGLIFKIDALGNLEWENIYGGTMKETFFSVQQTNDLGYVAAGFSLSNDGDISENKGEEDVWIIKIDINGDLEWSKTYGGSKGDVSLDVQQSEDGGYIVGGYTESDDGDVENNNGEHDFWIIKLDALGNLEWEKNFGGQATDRAQSLQKVSTGGYIVTGLSSSNDGDLVDNMGSRDIWIFKLDNDGNMEWQKNYGSSRLDNGIDIKETEDGGFIATGNTFSIEGNISTTLLPFSDLWIMKLAPLSVGLNENYFESNISIFPNPNSGIFTINTSMINTPTSIKIHDVSGKIIYTKTELNQLVEIDKLANGVYFLSLQSKDKIYFEKIIVH